MVQELLSLPLAQRLELVQQLWDSIAADQAGPGATAEERELIEQRLEAFRQDSDPGQEALAVLEELEQAL